jgi:acyl-CoA thioesterase I
MIGALTSDTPATWIFTGDSITHGLVHTAGYRSYVEHFHERLRGELDRTADCVINTAVNGNRTGDLIANFDHRVTRFAPAVVSVMLGTNDATAGQPGLRQFSENLTAIVAAIRATGAQPLLNTPPWIDVTRAQTRASLPEYAAVVAEVADRAGVPVIDHYAYWDGVDQARRLSWLADPFHPNARGHLELATTLFRGLEIFDPASPVCALEI